MADNSTETNTTYIPLYRKYRPATFSDVVGQEAIVKTLTNSIELGRVSHAYLFTGSRGTGKTSTARIFAKSLNCEKGPSPEPCGVCSSCRDINSGSAIDVIEIDAASNRKVEDARNLLEKVHFAPVAGKYKIYIIDEVHMLTTEAFNTLLKTLEEPPKNLVFILATTEAHKVLTTIISRCQRFDFRRIKNDLISKRLEYICKQEKLNIDKKALSIIAKRSAGGLRDALSLLDQVSILASTQKEVTDKDILTLLGSMPEEILSKVTDSIAQKDTATLLSLLDEIISLGNEPVQICRELIGYFRNLLLAKTAPKIEDIKDMLTTGEATLEILTNQRDAFEAEEIVQILEQLSKLEKTIKSSSQQHLWLEVGLIGICHRENIHVIKDMEDRISRLEQAISSGQIQAAAPARYNPQAIIKPAATKPPQTEEIVTLIDDMGISEPEAKIAVQEAPKPKPVIVSTAPVTIIEPKEEVTDAPATETLPHEPAETEQPTPVPAIQEIAAEPQAEPEHSMTQTATAAPASSGNLVDLWKQLLKGIESKPSQAIFMSQGKPVQINAEKIIIAFEHEIFVKKAQEKSKIDPLEEAARKMFGDLPQLVIRMAAPDDDKIRRQSVQTTAVIEEKKTPITQFIPKSELKPAPKIAEPESNSEAIEEDVITQLSNVNQTVERMNISEQAKMIVDLFNGKIIE